MSENIVQGFLFGLVTLVLLHFVVRSVIKTLKKRGGLEYQTRSEAALSLLNGFAFIEQLVFYFVAIAGKETFATITAGWVVFKGIQQWARWNSSRRSELGTGEKEIERLSNQDNDLKTVVSQDEKFRIERIKHDFREAQKGNLKLTRQEYLEQIDRNRFMIFVIGTGMSISVGGISGVVYHNLSWIKTLLKQLC